MRRALPYLWVTTRKNALKRFFSGLGKPKKLLGLVLRLGVVAFLLFGISQSWQFGARSEAEATALLTSYLAIVMVMAVLGGFTERGLAFTPADVEFLFAGPFGRRALVLHHLAGLYPATALSAVLPIAFFGAEMHNPVLGFVGAALCQVTATHVRLAASILAIEVGETTWRRMRGPLRVVATLVAFVLLGLIASVMTGMGGFRAIIASIATSPAARIAFYPAVAAADLASAPSLSAALPALLGALAVCGVTLAGLLSLQVNFLEASIGASDRLASIKARIKSGKGLDALTPAKRPSSGRALPSLGVFQGAGAVAWRNWIVARRSGLKVFVSVALVLVIFIPTFLSGRSEPMAALGVTGILPFFLASYFRFDFRGEGEQMARLKTLPVSRSRLAAAELAVPAALTVAVQALVLIVFAALGRIPVWWVPPALVVCGPVACGVIAVVNLAHFLGGKGTGVATLLQMVFLLADLVLISGLGWIFHALGFGWIALAALLTAAQVAILVALVALLGMAFAAHDVAQE